MRLLTSSPTQGWLIHLDLLPHGPVEAVSTGGNGEHFRTLDMFAGNISQALEIFATAAATRQVVGEGKLL